MVVFDVSSTMGATDVAPSNFAVAKSTTTGFAMTLPAGMKLGLVSYARTASVRAAPTVDRPVFVDAIDRLMLVNTTSAPQSAIETAIRQIQASGKAPGWIVLISDCKQPVDKVADNQEMGYFAARVLRHWGIPILTISLGPTAPVPVRRRWTMTTRWPGSPACRAGGCSLRRPRPR